MKLIIAIIQDEDASEVISHLNDEDMLLKAGTFGDFPQRVSSCAQATPPL